MEVLESFLDLLSEVWDIAVWTGAWYVLPIWILIELTISTVIIFIKQKKSKGVYGDNWKKRYFKDLVLIGLFLLAMRTLLTMFIAYIPISTSFTVELFSFTSYLLIVAVLASAITVWVLVKFHSMQSAKMKVYLVLLSIPITFFYSVAILIALF